MLGAAEISRDLLAALSSGTPAGAGSAVETAVWHATEPVEEGRPDSAADNSTELGSQYLRQSFGQGYWGKREGMHEWINDSETARILAGRLHNDHA